MNKFDEFEKSLMDENTWHYKLYLLVKGQLSRLASKYNIKEDVIDKNTFFIYGRTLKEVESDRQKYLVFEDKEKDSGNDTEKLLRAVLVGRNEAFYKLKDKEALEMINIYHIYPLVKEYELIEKNRQTKLEKSLILKHNKEIETKLEETETKVAQMTQATELKVKAGNKESIKYRDIVAAIKELIKKDPKFDITKKVPESQRERNQDYVRMESEIVDKICELKKCTWDKNQKEVAKKAIQKARHYFRGKKRL